MKKHIILLFISVLILGSGLFFTMTGQDVKKHQVTIKKINNEWRVVDSEDNSKSVVRSKRGEQIIWTAEGSDVYFQFMDEKLVGNYTRTLKDGQKLVLNVGNGAKSGSNPYAVFCIKDKEFARGQSPPAIIIE